MSSSAKYDVLCPLVPGGTSRSLLAVQKGIGGFRKLVVLRPVPHELVSGELAGARLVSEVKIAVGLHHPCIVSTHEVDVLEGQLYVVTEFTPGATLAELVEACRAAGARIPAGVVLRAVRDAAYALHYAHTFTDGLGRQRPLVHRAVTDRSVLITFDGAVKLLDFASGRRPQHERQRGCFAAPELLSGGEADPRADVFSLGAVTHSCLTGVRFHYAEVLAVSPTKAEFPPPSEKHPEVPAQVDPVLMRALYVDRNSRFRTALELAKELERVAGGLMARAEQCAQAVVKLFPGRREQLKAVVVASEERITTAVMPLSAILAGSPKGEALGERGLHEPTRQLQSPDELDDLEESTARHRQPPEAAGALIEDVPTGQVARASPRLKAQADSFGPTKAPPRKRRPVLKAFVALLTLAAVAGAGAWTLNPHWVRAKLAQARGRLGLASVSPIAAGGPEEIAMAGDAGETVAEVASSTEPGGTVAAAPEAPGASAGAISPATADAGLQAEQGPADAGAPVAVASGSDEAGQGKLAKKNGSDSKRGKRKNKRRK
ncbi:MAG: protein kinase [Myxococcales bacterium]|nr:protein kinase [Myxococcales bacterium]